MWTCLSRSPRASVSALYKQVHFQYLRPQRIQTRPPSAVRVSRYSKMAETAIPKSMPGILIEGTGGVDVLQWKTDLPVPQPKENEVLVKNEYIGVNYIDTYVRTGLYKATLPLITGKEAAGTVITAAASAGGEEGSPNFQPGDRVVYLHDGTYAAYTAVPATKLVGIPEGLSTATAAASLMGGLTALTMIREAAGLHPTAHLGVGQGPWALVHAAAGGTGSLLVQMLAALGAKVIAAAGGAEKCEVARRAGAAWVVDSRGGEDLVAKVKEITGGHGVDVVFDGVGKATFEADLEMVARKGQLVMFGNASGAVPPVDLLRLGAKNIKLMRPMVFNYIVTREELETYSKELMDLLLSDKVTVNIHEVYPLKDVARAHADLEGRKTTGKLLLKV